MKIANYRGQQCVFHVIHHLTTINTKLGLIDTCRGAGYSRGLGLLLLMPWITFNKVENNSV